METRKPHQTASNRNNTALLPRKYIEPTTPVTKLRLQFLDQFPKIIG